MQSQNPITSRDETAKSLIDLKHALALSDANFRRDLQRAVGLQTQTDAVVDFDSIQLRSQKAVTAQATAGLWNIVGATANNQPFSFCIKGVQSSAEAGNSLFATSTRRDHPFYWAREPLAYSSGLLASKNPSTIRSAHYFGALASPEGLRNKKTGMFLERVQGIAGEDMTRPQLELVAYQLGRMQGAFTLAAVDTKVLQTPWLARGHTREYATRIAANKMEFANSERAWNSEPFKPFVRRTFQGKTLREGAAELWAQRNTFLRVGEQLPTQTLSHNDFWYGQVFLAEKAVVIDLATVGTGPLGADIGKMAVEIASLTSASKEEMRDVENLLFDSYLEGLGDAGLRVKDKTVRSLVELGWKSHVAVIESWRPGGNWAPLEADPEKADVVWDRWGGRSRVEAFKGYADRTERFLEHGQRARELCQELAPYLSGKALDRQTLAQPGAIQAAEQVLSAISTGAQTISL